ELAVLEEMLSQKTLLLKAAFFQNTSRCRIEVENVRSDLHQSELLEGVPAHALNHRGHDAPPPKGLRQPVADLGSMGTPNLEVMQATAANHGVLGIANGKLHRTSLLRGDLGDDGKPLVSASASVWERNPQGALVDISVVEVFDESVLVR